MITKDAQAILLQVAHEAISYGLANGSEKRIDLNRYEPKIEEQRASFVTLYLYGELRGCIGTLEACQPLIIDVAHNAYAAAFSDPRFAPLTATEFKNIEIDISILNPTEEMNFNSEKELLAQLRPNIDGLILSDGPAQATFLPSVWQQIPEPIDFITHLKLKAGLSAHYWSDTIKMERYTTTKFHLIYAHKITLR